MLRHPGAPERDIAFVGGIDLCHSRRDDAGHAGDPQAVQMSAAYGPHPPWHDVQLAVRGPAVGALETTFRERWDDPTPLDSENPLAYLRDRLRGADLRPDPLPAQPRRPAALRPAPRCRCCAPTRRRGPATPSPRTASAAWPAATPRRSRGPGG